MYRLSVRLLLQVNYLNMNKKIAICLSGIPKYWNKSYESIRKWIPEADIFIHAWKIHDNAEINASTAYSCGSYNNIAQLNYQDIINCYNPKKSNVQDFYIKKDYFEAQRLRYFSGKNVNRGGSSGVSQLSMFYSLREACRLKTLYERENNFVYDIVIRMRFDSDIKTFVDLQSLECEDNLYIPNGRDWGGINDQFCFGSSKTLDMVCECYTFYDVLVEKANFFAPEAVFKQHIEMFLKSDNIKRENILIEINNTV